MHLLLSLLGGWLLGIGASRLQFAEIRSHRVIGGCAVVTGVVLIVIGVSLLT